MKEKPQNSLKVKRPKSLNIRLSYNKKVRINMKIETTKMSSRGQVVIPQNARDEISADEGTIFTVIANRDTIILKKMEMPSKEVLMKQLEEMAKEGKKYLEKIGIKESDIPDVVHKSRNKKD